MPPETGSRGRRKGEEGEEEKEEEREDEEEGNVSGRVWAERDPRVDPWNGGVRMMTLTNDSDLFQAWIHSMTVFEDDALQPRLHVRGRLFEHAPDRRTPPVLKQVLTE